MSLNDFNDFWYAYPRKVGKLAAMKAYAKARSIARPDEILAGVETYKRHKPDYADWAHPSSWLNAGRWMDEYDDPPALPSMSFDWYRECALLHQGSCGGSLKHQHQMILDRRKAEAS